MKAAGKQKAPGQSKIGAPGNAASKPAILSLFEQRKRALREQYLGPPQGEDGNDGRLQGETSKCESSTKRAILDAHATEKLEAFEAGFSQWQDSLCGAADACYNDCFTLVGNNRSECEVPSADFATSFTHECLSTFLRVTALDSAGEDREIASNRRVGWFVRHACGDWSDDFPSSYGLRAGESLTFRLPQYLSRGWMVRAKLAKRRWPNDYTVAPATDQLCIEETDKFILEKEHTLINALRDTIADARREAILGKIGTAPDMHPRIAPVSGERREMPEYKTEWKNAVYARLNQKHDASDRELCNWLDDQAGDVELPPSWAKRGNRSFTDAYSDATVRPNIESRFSEVRRDMRTAGYQIPRRRA